MVDIETLATTPSAAMISFGACHFDIDTGVISDKLNVNIVMRDVAKTGLVVSKDTLQWWLRQDKEVFRSSQENAISHKDAMKIISDYLEKYKNSRLWQWGSLDFPVIESNLIKQGYEAQWKYWRVDNARTVFNVFGVDIGCDRNAHHNAMQDAVDQAQYLIDFFQTL